MRILVFLPCLTLGGAERQGLLVARYLLDQGHDVEVWGFPSPGGRATLLPELRSHGLRHRELPSWPRLDWWFSQSGPSFAYFRGYCGWLKRRLAFTGKVPRRKFEVIIPFTFWPSLIGCLMRERLGAKRAFWNHRGGYDDAGMLYSPFLTKRVLSHRPQFLANSRAGGKFLEDTFGLSSAQVTIMPNAYAADLEGSKSESAPTNSPSSELSLIQVANLYPEKDWDTLLRSLQILNARGAVCRLHLCGEFPSASDRPKFFARVRELGIEHCIVHHGSIGRQEVFQLLLHSDIGLLSSKSEGQPNSVMEYMYIGLPVVATNIPGIREVVGEENEQWLFEVGDAEGLAGLITRLKENPVLRAELGLRNRRRIIEQFGPERVLPRWAELVERG